MDLAELGVTWEQAGLVVLTAIGIYVAVVGYTRVAGQRSLGQFSSFDFAVSVAAGSIIGRVVLVRTSLVAGLLGLGMLFVLQAAAGILRNRTSFMEPLDTTPILLVHDGMLLDDNLRRAHLRASDVYERLRLDGLGDLASARAVVLERNGMISVVTGGQPVTDEVFSDVPGWSAASGP